MLAQDTVHALVAGINDENEAFQIIHAIRAKFSMVGAEFCRDDIETVWEQAYDEGRVDHTFTDDHWDICVGLRSWYRMVQDAMIEAAHYNVMDVVVEDIDREYNR